MTDVDSLFSPTPKGRNLGRDLQELQEKVKNARGVIATLKATSSGNREVNKALNIVEKELK